MPPRLLHVATKLVLVGSVLGACESTVVVIVWARGLRDRADMSINLVTRDAEPGPVARTYEACILTT